MRCPKCNSIFSNDNYFCFNDGVRLVDDSNEEVTIVKQNSPQQPAGAMPGFPTDVVCSKCGMQNKSTSTFCKKCGQPTSDPYNSVPHFSAVSEPVTVPRRDAFSWGQPGPAQSNGSPYDEKTVVMNQPLSAQPRSGVGGQGNSINPMMIFLGILVFVLAAAVLILLAGDRSSGGDVSRNVPKTPEPTPAPSSTPPPTNTVPTVKPTPNTTPRPSQNGGDKSVFQGYSMINGRLPLTLTLFRDGNGMSGSAKTPGDLDDLNGSIDYNDNFVLEGYNRKTGRVTGTWRGRIDGDSLSGVWTSTGGVTIRFYGTRTY